MATSDQAIVIGIRTYPKLQSLRGPCHDAEAFREWLTDPDGGDVPAANVKFLVTDAYSDPDVTEHPNVSEMEDLFGEFVERGVTAASSGQSLGRRLYIFLAGHGFSEPSNMTEVALFSANAGSWFAPNLAATRWAEWFRANGVFDEVVLVMDCCRTTSPTSRMVNPPLPALMGSPRRGNVRWFYAYAVTDGQQARERELEAGTWRGIFTSAFLEAMAHALPDDRGRVNGREVADYVHLAVGMEQPPEFVVAHSKDVLFAQRQHADTVAVGLRLAPYVGGETVVISDSRNDEVMRTDPVEADVTVHLEPGLYKAAIDGADRSTLFKVPSDDDITI